MQTAGRRRRLRGAPKSDHEHKRPVKCRQNLQARYTSSRLRTTDQQDGSAKCRQSLQQRYATAAERTARAGWFERFKPMGQPSMTRSEG